MCQWVTKCLATRFLSSPCLPCYAPDTLKLKKYPSWRSVVAYDCYSDGCGFDLTQENELFSFLCSSKKAKLHRVLLFNIQYLEKCQSAWNGVYTCMYVVCMLYTLSSFCLCCFMRERKEGSENKQQKQTF